MLPTPPLVYETVTLPCGRPQNVSRVAPLRALLDHLEAAAGRQTLQSLLIRRETQVIRTQGSPVPLILSGGHAYSWGEGWTRRRPPGPHTRVVTTYPLSPSHLTLSLLREQLLTVNFSHPVDVHLHQALRLYACLCPLQLLGVPEPLASQIRAAVTPQDHVSSQTLYPPDQRPSPSGRCVTR